MTGESELSSRVLPNNRKIGVRERETPPPEQPHVAFQSPLLEYSSALGLGVGGGLSPNSQPAGPTFPRTMDTPRYQTVSINTKNCDNSFSHISQEIDCLCSCSVIRNT